MNIFDSWICKQYIAHRGFYDENNPENSLPAFERAIENNFAIELDVRGLADGTVVVFRDSTLGRMTGADGFIANYTYEDIKPLTLLKTKEHIPTLEEALNFINGRTPVLIEIKNMGKVANIEQTVWNVLKKYKGEYAVQSFNPYSLEWFKINAPHVTRGQTASFYKGVKNVEFAKKFSLKRMLLNKKVSEPHFINYKVEDLPNRYVRKYKDLPLLCWVVREDTFERAKKVADNMIFEGFNPNNYTTKIIDED